MSTESPYGSVEDSDESVLNEQLYAMLKEQQAHIEHLDGQLEEERQRREELEDTLEIVQQPVFDLDDVVVGSEYTASLYAEENPPLLAQLANLSDGETIADLREDLINEQKTRSRQDSQINRKINELADASGVDLDDADVAGQDKIQRMIANGPEDVTDRVYAVHERAREVLLHAGEWGTAVEDSFGRRITLKGPEVREKLELVRNEDLQSKQVGDVFDKIVELAADSPRKVKTDKNGDGVRVLRIHLQQEGL
ncbi:hypothetical protein [Haloarcula sebkhae]|uniref:Uncharacterized protein n=2 Tax=Haloarcula sebkhae TaxID=932660 RepID=A0ACC6VL71_9EURY|nr:hypothetical protein [Haloarcula sebkhae]GGK84582.1 hypothetical protein GCM10009067_40950 [Haloarcula sebkhae]